jgi:TolC family type I secretion outer membrane protein
MAESLFQNGQGTKTDIEDAKSRLDAAMADEEEIKNNIFVAEQFLSSIIGVKVLAYEIKPINPKKIPPKNFNLAKLEEWINIGQDKNPEIIALKINLESAGREIQKRTSGHYPTIDLIASESLSKSDASYTVGQQYNTQSIGLQVLVPIYAGGGINSSINQSIANQEKIRFDLEGAIKKNAVEITRQYHLTLQSVARIKALEQALVSSDEAIKGNQKGVEAGTRNIVDVLSAQQQFYTTQSNLIDARHNYINALLKLKAASGILNDDDITEVNGWLN